MKKLFPIFSNKKDDRDLIYLDSAATSHKPASVIDAITRFYTHDYSTVHRGVYSSALEATSAMEDIRQKAAKFISCSAEEVIFTHSATEAINLVASCYGEINIQEGDEVLVSIAEHHSNYLPWKMLCKHRGAVLVTADLDDEGKICLFSIQEKISSKTKIVAICHQSNVLGVINPVKEIASIAHENNAVILVDGAQIIAHEKVDVQDLDADFYIFSGHKMYGPTGVGVLYGKKSLLQKMQPFHLGGGMVEDVSDDIVYRESPYKFEAGTPMLASIVGLGAAIDFLLSIGFDTIKKREKVVSEKFYDALKDQVTFICPSCRGSSILSFIPNTIHPVDFAMLLSLENISLRVGNMCAQPLLKDKNIDSLVRISFGVYNDTDDLKAFISSLSSLKQIS